MPLIPASSILLNIFLLGAQGSPAYQQQAPELYGPSESSAAVRAQPSVCFLSCLSQYYGFALPGSHLCCSVVRNRRLPTLLRPAFLMKHLLALAGTLPQSSWRQWGEFIAAMVGVYVLFSVPSITLNKDIECVSCTMLAQRAPICAYLNSARALSVSTLNSCWAGRLPGHHNYAHSTGT